MQLRVHPPERGELLLGRKNDAGRGPNALLLRAAWVLPDSNRACPAGWVRIRDGAVVDLGDGPAPDPAGDESLLDFPGATILPGLVNAHCHLDLTGLRERIPEPRSFPSWLRSLLLQKLLQGPGDEVAAIRRGIAESLAEGVTAIGDIDTSGRSGALLAEAGLAGIAYQEVLGFTDARGIRALDRARARIRAGRTPQGETVERGRVRAGLSPHAPYSTAACVYREAGRDASRGVAVCTHAAESDAERAFLESGRGELHRFFRRFGAIPASWRPPGRSTIRHLDDLGFLGPRTLLVHANDLDDEEVACVRERGAAVAFCPRSHAYFRHRHLAVRRLLEAGVCVALGTDSLASNRSLSLLEEARVLCRRDPALGADVAFSMMTRSGARALGLPAPAGTIARGGRADLAVAIAPPERDPFEALLDERTRIVETFLEGRPVHGPRVDRSGRTA